LIVLRTIGQRLIGQGLTSQGLTVRAAGAQLAVQAAPARGNLAQGDLLEPKEIARGPLPPAAVSLAQAAPGPAINTLARLQRGNRRGNQNQGVPADQLPEAVRNRLVPDPAGFRNPAPATRARQAAEESQREGGRAAKVMAASRGERSVAEAARDCTIVTDELYVSRCNIRDSTV
jgi:hypothetical protein